MQTTSTQTPHYQGDASMKAVGQYGVVSMEAIGESFPTICRCVCTLT